MTGIGLPAIVDWLHLIRAVCTYSIVNSHKLIGSSATPIQIDESHFRGRRKYSRVRLLNGDIGVGSNFSRKNNYGTEVNGPWVFRIYKSSEEVRFVLVPDRRAQTLLPIIQDNV